MQRDVWDRRREDFIFCSSKAKQVQAFLIIFQLVNQSSHRRMMKYTPRTKADLADLLNRTAGTSKMPQGNPLDPKHLPARPPNLQIPKKTSRDFAYDSVLTPKTARTTYQHHPTPNSSFNRSNHVTPEPDKSRKDTSFTTPIKAKPTESTETSFQKENEAQPRLGRTDRSQRVLKTIMIRDNVMRTEDKTFLRQTVSNLNAWRNPKAVNTPPSPIKLFSDLRKEKKTSNFEEPSFRKKIESQYLPSFTPPYPPETSPSEPKSKIYSTTHSRDNSAYGADPNPNPPILEALSFKTKEMPSGKTTPRGSQDKLTASVNLLKQKSMNMTDPSGSYFQISRELSSLRLSTKRETPFMKIEDFQLGSCKGEGRFGKVFPAIHKITGCLVAIKQIKKEQLRLMMDQFVQELKINLFSNHPNVVKMYGFFCDKTYFYILMEYMQDGSLYKYIKVNKKLKEDDAANKLYEICDAVNYLHEQDVLHRDIKPENIVLSNGVCKLCDFGWATYSTERRNTYCGTLDYVCPEILEGESYDNFVDIWAIGVLAYEMLTGKAPFYHISRKQTMKSIMNCQFSFPTEMSVSAKLFIKKALQKSPDQRFTIQSLFKDRFLSQCGNF